MPTWEDGCAGSLQTLRMGLSPQIHTQVHFHVCSTVHLHWQSPQSLGAFIFSVFVKKQTPSCGGSWLVYHVPLLRFPEITVGPSKEQVFHSIVGCVVWS